MLCAVPFQYNNCPNDGTNPTAYQCMGCAGYSVSHLDRQPINFATSCGTPIPCAEIPCWAVELDRCRTFDPLTPFIEQCEPADRLACVCYPNGFRDVLWVHPSMDAERLACGVALLQSSAGGAAPEDIQIKIFSAEESAEILASGSPLCSEVGACCNENGGCTQTTPCFCGSLGRVFHRGKTCAEVQCGPGACCACEWCRNRTAGQCQADGGLFHNPALDCSGGLPTQAAQCLTARLCPPRKWAVMEVVRRPSYHLPTTPLPGLTNPPGYEIASQIAIKAIDIQQNSTESRIYYGRVGRRKTVQQTVTIQGFFDTSIRSDLPDTNLSFQNNRVEKGQAAESRVMLYLTLLENFANRRIISAQLAFTPNAAAPTPFRCYVRQLTFPVVHNQATWNNPHSTGTDTPGGTFTNVNEVAFDAPTTLARQRIDVTAMVRTAVSSFGSAIRFLVMAEDEGSFQFWRSEAGSAGPTIEITWEPVTATPEPYKGYFCHQYNRRLPTTSTRQVMPCELHQCGTVGGTPAYKFIAPYREPCPEIPT